MHPTGWCTAVMASSHLLSSDDRPSTAEWRQSEADSDAGVDLPPLAKIIGLKGRSDLNGCQCVVVKYVESRGRYAVEVCTGGALDSLPPPHPHPLVCSRRVIVRPRRSTAKRSSSARARSSSSRRRRRRIRSTRRSPTPSSGRCRRTGRRMRRRQREQLQLRTTRAPPRRPSASPPPTTRLSLLRLACQDGSVRRSPASACRSRRRRRASNRWPP